MVEGEINVVILLFSHSTIEPKECEGKLWSVISVSIQILDEQTINTIAAGEVIENSASVVKELVENSLDAGAEQIVVEIAAGGRQLIRVSDDGCGMSSDDALLSLERHATSKMRTAADIEMLSTMGFRGEALPSIAAISKFTLMTCVGKGEFQQGTVVTVEGGKMLYCRPAGRAQGTTIEVKQLFYNVPARKKYQKSIAHDSGEIHKMITALALAHPSLSFKYINNGKSVLSLPRGEGEDFTEMLRTRIITLLGSEYSSALLPISYENEVMKIQGFISTPSYTRPNRRGQYHFVNKRSIFSSALSYALSNGYATRLQPGRFPASVLHLTLPGNTIDVNVHPQKREIRFRDERALRALFSRLINEALSSSSRPAPFSQFPPSFSPRTFVPAPSMPPAAHQLPAPGVMSTPLPATATPAMPQEIEPHPYATLGVFSRYIIATSKDALVLIDGYRAQLRITYDTLSNTSQPPAVQSLLIPETVELSQAEALQLLPLLDLLQQFGIGIREFGGTSFIIDALPQTFDYADIATFLHSILSDMSTTDQLADQRSAALALALARASIPRRKFLTPEQAPIIVNTLMSSCDPYHCPQGKPIIRTLTEKELHNWMSHGPRENFTAARSHS